MNLDFDRMREAERAKVARWFTRDGPRTIFHAADGSAVWINAAEADHWRAKADAHIDASIEAMGDAAKIAGGLSVIMVLLLVVLVSSAPARSIGIDELLMALAASAWPGWVTWQHFAGLRALRAEIAASLARAAPLPRDYRGATQRGNPVALVLNVVVGVVVLAALVSHLYPAIVTAIPPIAYLIVVPLAWGLHFAARAVDRKG